MAVPPALRLGRATPYRRHQPLAASLLAAMVRLGRRLVHVGRAAALGSSHGSVSRVTVIDTT